MKEKLECMRRVFREKKKVFTFMVKTIDLEPEGPMNSNIGFSSINTSVFNLIGVHPFFEKITKIIGYLAILIAGIFAVLGFLELYRVKKLRKVDKRVIILGFFYVIVIFVYFLFDKIVINYRPSLSVS